MIKSVTETASALTGVAQPAFVIYPSEAAHDNVDVGGKLLEDRIEENSEQDDINNQFSDLVISKEIVESLESLFQDARFHPE